jgi:hypothetical protein
VNVVAPQAAVGAVTLDGSPIPAGDFVPIGASGFGGAQVEISPGTHNLASPLPFGVFVYGFALTDSYGYPGGMHLGPVASVADVLLNPPSATKLVGTEHCVLASLTDSDAGPVPDIRVDFEASGVNQASGFAWTDADGGTEFCYTGQNLGTDSILASAGVISDSAQVTWTDEEGPVANDDTATTDEDMPITLDVLANDRDPDGAPLTVSQVGAPANGIASTDGGTVIYTPTLNFYGTEVFNYTVSDGALTDTAAITVVVRPVNDAPVADDQAMETDEDSAVDITLTAYDPDGDVLTYIIVSTPTHGTLSGSPPGVTYTPDAGYTGPDAFTFIASDGLAESEAAAVKITVNPPFEMRDVLRNGDFEEGFQPDELGNYWSRFDNGGADYSFHIDDWPLVVVEGEHTQMLEIKNAQVPDRYFGIYQTAEVIPGEVYTFSMRGLVRTNTGDVEKTRHGYRLQVGFDLNGGQGWEAVTEWVELPWDEQQRVQDNFRFDAYTATLTAESDRLTVFIRACKKWADAGEGDYDVDDIRLVGPMRVR